MKFTTRFAYLVTLAVLSLFLYELLNTNLINKFGISPLESSQYLWLKTRCRFEVGNWFRFVNIPDIRSPRCKKISYNLAKETPTVSIILEVKRNEWSGCLRTLYSIIDNTPTALITEIILITTDINSRAMECIYNLFKLESIKIGGIFNVSTTMEGRQLGLNKAVSDNIIFLNSRTEVNQYWLEPLLDVIINDESTVGISILDTIDSDRYTNIHDGYLPVYGWDWSLSIFPIPHTSSDTVQPYSGVVMSKLIFAVNRKFFIKLGGFSFYADDNDAVTALEISWRTWTCGGKLVHVPCSRISIIQPNIYTTTNLTLYNYKTLIHDWMDSDTRQFVYDSFNRTQNKEDVLQVKSDFKTKNTCKPFKWYLDTIWSDLFLYNCDVYAWGSVQNYLTSRCLDNHGYMLRQAEDVYLDKCHYKLMSQGFSLTKTGLLRTTLNCVVVLNNDNETRPMLQQCSVDQLWSHVKDGRLEHIGSRLCLDIDYWGPVMNPCNNTKLTQKWSFTKYVLEPVVIST